MEHLRGHFPKMLSMYLLRELLKLWSVEHLRGGCPKMSRMCSLKKLPMERSRVHLSKILGHFGIATRTSCSCIVWKTNMDDFYFRIREPLAPDWRGMLGENPFDGTDILPRNLNRHHVSVISAQEFLQLTQVKRSRTRALRHICRCWNLFEASWWVYTSI